MPQIETYSPQTNEEAEAAYKDLLKCYAGVINRYPNLGDTEIVALIGRLAGMLIAQCDRRSQRDTRKLIIINMDHATQQYMTTIIAGNR